MDSLPPQPPVEIHEQIKKEDFKHCPNLAQYKGSDFANAVRVERGITLEEAFEIARADQEIDYFFYTKGIQMALEVPSEAEFDPNHNPLDLATYVDFQGDREEMHCGGYCRIFRYGDVVFFKNEGKWLGSAPGLADIYEKQ